MYWKETSYSFHLSGSKRQACSRFSRVESSKLRVCENAKFVGKRRKMRQSVPFLISFPALLFPLVITNWGSVMVLDRARARSASRPAPLARHVLPLSRVTRLSHSPRTCLCSPDKSKREDDGCPTYNWADSWTACSLMDCLIFQFTQTVRPARFPWTILPINVFRGRWQFYNSYSIWQRFFPYFNHSIVFIFGVFQKESLAFWSRIRLSETKRHSTDSSL